MKDHIAYAVTKRKHPYSQSMTMVSKSICTPIALSENVWNLNLSVSRNEISKLEHEIEYQP
jgi:hypothetical protein